ncbi:MAG: hypothetical protein AABW48_05405 [Nanoarchaeota archaeon]
MSIERIIKSFASKSFFSSSSFLLPKSFIPKAIVPLTLSILTGCSSGNVYENNFYNHSNKDSNNNNTYTHSGAEVKSGTTNEEGNIFFIDEQDGSIISINVKDVDTGLNLAKVDSIFADGNDFAGYVCQKEGYISFFDVSDGASEEFAAETDLAKTKQKNVGMQSQKYSEATIFDYYFNTNPTKYYALEKYADWAEKEGYVFVKCVTKEELKEQQDRTGAILAMAEEVHPLFKIVNTVFNGILKLEEWGVLNNLSAPVYNVYEPLNFTGYPLYKGSNECK